MSVVSNEPPASPVENSIQGSLEHLRSTQDALAEFLDQVFSELEQNERKSAAADEALRHGVEELTADRDCLKHELELTRQEITNLAGISVELANTRAELAAALAKVGRLREQLALATDTDQDLRSQIGDLEVERRGLEAELDLVRRRSVELAEELNEQRRLAGEDRSTWMTELKEWRQLLERQSNWLAAQGGGLAVGRGEGLRGSQKADPVLGSVLAQFEKLQKKRTSRPDRPPE